MVQTSSMDIPDKEFLNIVRMHRLSTVVLYATFLGRLINSAQQDTEMKDALKSIDQIIHTGVALHKEEEEWAYANGIKIVVCDFLPCSRTQAHTSRRHPTERLRQLRC